MIEQQYGGKHSVFYFLIVLFSLFLFYPYEFVSVYMPFMPMKEYVIAAFVFFILVFAGLISSKSFKIEALPFIIVQIIGFSFIELLHGKFFPIFDYALRMLLAGLMVGFLRNTMGLSNFFRKYNRWITIMAVLGVVTWVLVNFFNYSPLYFVIDRADERPIFNYLLTFTKSDVFASNTFRYAGFFDEPGAMAYWGLFALLFNRLFVKDRKIEIVLIACLLLTFSMGFYFQLLFYLLFFMLSKTNRKTTFFAFVVVAVLAIGASMMQGTKNDFIYESTFGRLERLMEQGQDSDAASGVGNRSEYQEKAYREFLKNPVTGTAEADSLNLGDNIFEPLAKYGILGTLLMYFPLFYIFFYAAKRKQMDVIKAIIIILIGFFHRPLHMNVLTLFMMYSMLTFVIRKPAKRLANG